MFLKSMLVYLGSLQQYACEVTMGWAQDIPHMLFALFSQHEKSPTLGLYGVDGRVWVLLLLRVFRSEISVSSSS